MEVRVKITRPICSTIHHRDKNDEHSYVYYMNKDDTLENMMSQVF